MKGFGRLALMGALIGGVFVAGAEVNEPHARADAFVKFNFGGNAKDYQFGFRAGMDTHYRADLTLPPVVAVDFYPDKPTQAHFVGVSLLDDPTLQLNAAEGGFLGLSLGKWVAVSLGVAAAYVAYDELDDDDSSSSGGGDTGDGSNGGGNGDTTGSSTTGSSTGGIIGSPTGTFGFKARDQYSAEYLDWIEGGSGSFGNE